MKVKIVLNEINKFEKKTGFDYQEIEKINLFQNISEFIQNVKNGNRRIFCRFSDVPDIETNLDFKKIYSFENPFGFYSYNFPTYINDDKEIQNFIENIYKNPDSTLQKAFNAEHGVAIDSKYLIFFTFLDNILEFNKFNDTLSEEKYQNYLNKIYDLCKEKIENWKNNSSFKDLNSQNYYNNLIKEILQYKLEGNYSEAIPRNSNDKSSSIYKICYYLALNWKNNIFSLDHNKSKAGRKVSYLTTYILQKIGINGIVDRGTSTLWQGEPSQSVFFKIKKMKILGVINIDNVRNKLLREKEDDKVSNTEELESPKNTEFELQKNSYLEKLDAFPEIVNEELLEQLLNYSEDKFKKMITNNLFFKIVRKYCSDKKMWKHLVELVKKVVKNLPYIINKEKLLDEIMNNKNFTLFIYFSELDENIFSYLIKKDDELFVKCLLGSIGRNRNWLLQTKKYYDILHKKFLIPLDPPSPFNPKPSREYTKFQLKILYTILYGNS